VFKDRKSVIVLKIDDRYETIGILLPHDKIQRIFEYKENIIKKINTFLFDKNKLLKKYPSLIYVQKDNYNSKDDIYKSDESDNTDESDESDNSDDDDN
jgi:hypothetical protein